MNGCPSCGHTGAPESQVLKDFVLLICSECGTGLGIERKSSDGSVTPRSLSEPETPATGAYELSPTGQHSVITHTMIQTGQPKPSEHSEEVGHKAVAEAKSGDGIVFLVSESESLVSATQEAGRGSNAFGDVVGFQSAIKMIEAFIRAIRAGQDLALIAIDSDIDNFSADQLSFVIRSLETGLGASRTSLLVLCDDESEWAERSRGLGSTRALSLPTGLSEEETCARMVALFERFSG